MLHSLFQFDYQINREKLRIQPFIYIVSSYNVFPHNFQAKVGLCFETDDIFLLRDYDLLVIHVRFPTSFDALQIPLLNETADVSWPD